MFAFVRLNRCLQCNFVSATERSESEEREDAFNEIQICWNSQKLNRPLWKTKKFYDSRTVASYGDTCLGKAYAYVNKLFAGKWLTDDDYAKVWEQLLKLEHSDLYRSYGYQGTLSKGVWTYTPGGDRRKNPRAVFTLPTSGGKGAVRVPSISVPRWKPSNIPTTLADSIDTMSEEDYEAFVRGYITLKPVRAKLDGIPVTKLDKALQEWMAKYNSLPDSDASGNE